MVFGVDVGIPIAAAAVLSLLGGGILVSGVRSYWVQKRAVSRAEEASGMIETVDIQPVIGSGGDTYVPTVKYEYQTPTQRLRGDALYPGGNQVSKVFHSESAANAPIESYEPGTETRVYYMPSTPDHSFLIPEIHRGPALAKISFGLGLCGLALVVLFQTGI
jgi:hypothetical protein